MVGNVSQWKTEGGMTWGGPKHSNESSKNARLSKKRAYLWSWLFQSQRDASKPNPRRMVRDT